MVSKNNKITYRISYISMCVALLSISAWLVIPFPVSITLQTMVLFLIAFISDWKDSLLAVGLYLLLGCLGAPIFSGFSGGLGVLLGYTGGYLLAFPFMVLIIGGFKQWLGNSRSIQILSSSIALLVCYTMGSGWYYFNYTSSSGTMSPLLLLSICVIPFLLPDLLKLTLAILLADKILKFKKN